jgi:hypothetical protein
LYDVHTKFYENRFVDYYLFVGQTHGHDETISLNVENEKTLFKNCLQFLATRCKIVARFLATVDFYLYHRLGAVSAAHTASYPLLTRAVSPGVKRPGRQTDRWPPSSTKLKNAWSYNFIPVYVVLDLV